MKIAMISWEFPPQFSGGLGIHCQALANELTNANLFLDFYMPYFGERKEAFSPPRGMNLYHVDTELLHTAYTYSGDDVLTALPYFQRGLEEMFSPEGIDLIHAHDWMGAYSSIKIAKRYKIPLIMSVHSLEQDRAAYMPPHTEIKQIEKEALHAADYIITVSERSKISIIEQYSIPPEKISVVYNGIEPALFSIGNNPLNKSKEPYILFLGRVTAQKGPHDFLKAARIVLEHRDAKFVIAGEGDLKGLLRRQAKLWGIDDKVEFTGKLTGTALYECYQNALVYVLPSIAEPFGITVLEAMSAGIPVITTTVTGAAEILNQVIKVEPNQPELIAKHIIKLLDNPIMRQNKGNDGRQEVLHWTWEKTASQTSQVYQTVLKLFVAN